MTRRISISSEAFEDLIRRLPSYVDVTVTADMPGPKAKKYAVIDDVTYVAPNPAVAR